MTISNRDDSVNRKNKRRILSLIISRIAITTLLLAITVFIDARRQLFGIPYAAINIFYVIVVVIYLFSSLYIVLYKLKINYLYNLYLQIAIDIVTVTFLIFMFGNTQIDYSLFYTLIIIYSALFLEGKED